MREMIFTSMFLLFQLLSSAQIVNIESERIQSDTTGWLGKLGANFLLEKNAVRVTSINANAHVEYKAPRSLYLFLFNYNFLKGEGKTLNSNLFYHLRYNYKLNKWLRWEVFTQLQQNNITGIRLRFLAGSGPRFKIVSQQKFSLYVATAAMYEYEEEITTPTVYHNDIRSSSYASFTYKPTTNVRLATTLFYQPLYNNFNDYRLLNEISLKLKIVKHFSFTVGWNYLYDSRPAAGKPRTNYSISNGIEYVF